MYEQQTPFELADFIGLSSFINNLLFKGIHGGSIGMRVRKIIFRSSYNQQLLISTQIQ